MLIDKSEYNSILHRLHEKRFDSKMKVFIDNLVIFNTQRCNLRCPICFNGEPRNRDISEGTIDALFRQIDGIIQIHFSGGEFMTAPDVLEMIIEKLIYYKIYVQLWGSITNATIYSGRIQKLLKKLDDYCVGYNPNLQLKGTYKISSDQFHHAAIRDLGADSYQCYRNIMRNMNSPFYGGHRDILPNIVNIGRAKDLDIPGKEEPTKNPIILGLVKNKYVYVGPMVDVCVNGLIKAGHIDFGEREAVKELHNINNHSFWECIANDVNYILDDMDEFELVMRQCMYHGDVFTVEDNGFAKIKYIR